MNDGGSAFPITPVQTGIPGTLGSFWQAAQPGMSLRDYFAAAALTGLCANSHNDGVHKPLSIATALEMAEMAYWHADEMLKYRDAEPQHSSGKGDKT